MPDHLLVVAEYSVVVARLFRAKLTPVVVGMWHNYPTRYHQSIEEMHTEIMFDLHTIDMLCTNTLKCIIVN